MASDLGRISCSGCEQFWNTDQVIGDEVEQEVGGYTSDAAVLGLAHGAVELAPPKMHSIIARRDCDKA